MRERVQTKVACTMDDTMIIQKKKKSWSKCFTPSPSIPVRNSRRMFTLMLYSSRSSTPILPHFL